ncbi:hypothetical protein [Dyella humicola]|uniref:hypothetical protein n=1 Tax=Dyella humicola TaxID=2992126 RepID=UPI002257F823|nr:hypothetical protein [Dyella humicola]
MLFELADAAGPSLHLAIRYFAFQNKEVEGDHIYLDGLEAAKSELEAAFDIEPEEWRSLTPDEANVVDASIG